jgi:hypothetical protein
MTSFGLERTFDFGSDVKFKWSVRENEHVRPPTDTYVLFKLRVTARAVQPVDVVLEGGAISICLNALAEIEVGVRVAQSTDLV